MRTTFNLPDALLTQARLKAAAEGRTVTSLVVEGLHRVLHAEPVDPAQTRRLPRVSTASGGLMPGWDPDKLGVEFEEQEDLERMERIERQQRG